MSDSIAPTTMAKPSLPYDSSSTSYGKQANSRHFRYDINALRALAAMAVVLFHFHAQGFGGGFVGVDIFFVISGLLMTQIIERGVERGGFSILGFYAARARRILPALFGLCASVVLSGMIFMDPLTLAETARNSIASILFVSNITYALQSGYFADSSESNWLLHTWTLSVEWQFYMIYPIILVFASRSAALWRYRFEFLLAGCSLAFFATLWVASYSAHLRDYAFFLLPTRAWEMLIGGVLAIWAPHPSRAMSTSLACAGFASIFASIFGFYDAVPWPSIWTLLPVLGTVAVLAAGQQQSGWARLPGVQPLGTWSYSIYLWHWPIFVGFTYFGLEMTVSIIALGVFLSVVAGAFSYFLIETRLRDIVFGNSIQISTRRWVLIVLGSGALVAGFAATKWTTGFESIRTRTFSTAAGAQLSDFRAAKDDWKGLKECDRIWRIGTAQGCVLGGRHALRIAVIGDSHAEQMIPRFKRLAALHNIEITVLRNPGCAPLSGLLWTRGGGECSAFAAEVFPMIMKGGYTRAVVVSAWALYFGDVDNHWAPGAICTRGWSGCWPEAINSANERRVEAAFVQFSQRLQALRAAGVKVAILLPEPFNFDLLPRDYYREVFSSGRMISPPVIDRASFQFRTNWIRSKLEISAERAGVQTIDPLPFLCDVSRCPLTIDGHFIYKDKHHARASIVAVAPAFGYLDSFVLHGASSVRR